MQNYFLLTAKDFYTIIFILLVIYLICFKIMSLKFSRKLLNNWGIIEDEQQEKITCKDKLIGGVYLFLYILTIFFVLFLIYLLCFS